MDILFKLYQELKNDFHETEKNIKEIKRNKYFEDNSLHFNMDGHWNKNANYEMFKFLKRSFINN